MAVLAVVENVVGIPLVLAPLQAFGQFLLRILHFAVLGAEFLAELDGAGRADFHALAAGNAVLFVDMGPVGGGGEVRGVEVLAGTQREADADIAVADAEYLVLTIDVGDLVNVTVLFGTLQDLQRLFLGDGTAFAGLDQVVGEIADADAAVVLDLAGTDAVKPAGVAAGAVADGDLSVILVQPVGQMLDGSGNAVRGDGGLHREDMHADAVAARRDQMGLAFQREEGHLVEAVGQLGILLDLREHHVGHLGDAGNEQLDVPLLLMLRVLPVVLHDAGHGAVHQELLEMFFRFSGQFRDLRDRLGLA